MRKNLFLMLTFFVLSAASVNAQVRIGGTDDPNASAILDLNPDAGNATLGLALPRVQLTSTTDVVTIANPAIGLTAYNLTTAGSGATAVVPGIYYYNGGWIRLSGSAPVIITQPAPFSFSRLQDGDGDPNGPATATAVNLSVTTAGAGTLTYKWYEKPKNVNSTVRGSVLASTAGYTPDVTAWGMRSYYCVVSNGTDSVVSNVADVAIGCGAKTFDGGWLQFMCYNLGADTSLDPFTYTSINDTTSFDSKGWLFQWGRAADGHQWRSSPVVQGPLRDSVNVQVPQANVAMYGKFITNTLLNTFNDWRSPQVDYQWRTGQVGPCPAGWTLPSGDLFASAVSAGHVGAQSLAEARANTITADATGVYVRPDGHTVTLFLPGAGERNHQTGAVEHTDWVSCWGSRTFGSLGEIVLYFDNANPSRLLLGSQYFRARGYAVRCVYRF
jgi:hypothetical protein